MVWYENFLFYFIVWIFEFFFYFGYDVGRENFNIIKNIMKERRYEENVKLLNSNLEWDKKNKFSII